MLIPPLWPAGLWRSPGKPAAQCPSRFWRSRMPSLGNLYTAPPSEPDYELVRAFVLSAEQANLFSESLTFEVKEQEEG